MFVLYNSFRHRDVIRSQTLCYGPRQQADTGQTVGVFLISKILKFVVVNFFGNRTLHCHLYCFTCMHLLSMHLYGTLSHVHTKQFKLQYSYKSFKPTQFFLQTVVTNICSAHTVTQSAHSAAHMHSVHYIKYLCTIGGGHHMDSTDLNGQ